MVQLPPRKRLELSPSVRSVSGPLDSRQDRYRGPIAGTVHRLTEAVARQEIPAEQLLDELQSTFDETDMAAEFASWTDTWPSGEKVERWLCRRRPGDFLRGPRHPGTMQDLNMRLKLFYLKPHRSEPPHYHNMMASLQCVISGRIYCRQYDRVARTDENVVMIRPVSQRELTVGQTFRTTDHKDNVHWFGTEDEPAVVLDFYIEGKALYETPFEPDAKRSHGRHYLDPTGQPDADNLIAAGELGVEEAYRRFASKSILSFEWHGTSSAEAAESPGMSANSPGCVKTRAGRAAAKQ